MSDARRPLIVCPLEFEARALRRAGLGRAASIACCGPGARGVERWSAAAPSSGHTVILAGLAGGLTDDHRAGDAWLVAEVRDAAARAWHPTLTVPAMPESSCVTLSTTDVVTACAEKRALAHQHGVHLVDLESAPFAALAAERGWRWAVVRGVSDDVDTTLPAPIASWVDERGRTRTARAIGDVLRQPRLVREARVVARRSANAMRAVAGVVQRLLD